MKRDILQLKSEQFDILVIGGGINGAAIARDAALRGARIALIEKDDFACGASGNTTKLIHGGIRYLEQFNFKLVYEALRERAILLRTVPHLVKPLEFIIPVYKHDPRSLLKIKTGVFIYDRLAGRDNIRRHRSLSAREIISLAPQINTKDLKGGALYCDAQMDDIRLCLDNAISAYDSGACIANKVEAIKFVKDKGKITAVMAEDRITGEIFNIPARVVVNATGAWSNSVVRTDEPGVPAITRPTKGIHIIYKKLLSERALVLSAHKDKRIFFVIPWRGLSLIGTTDTDFDGSPDEVYTCEHDVDYLLDEVRRVFPDENIDKREIITTYSGLRPLVDTEGKPAWQVSREHLIKESASGLISVIGGKYTTYRHLAEQVVDIALKRLENNPARTIVKAGKKCITQEVGPQAQSAEETDLEKRVERAVKDEMANTLRDLLIRRLQLATTPSLGLDRAGECVDIMARLLGWNDAQKEFEIRAYRQEADRNRSF